MILTLHTETFVSSCHHLEGYDGKCKNMHGHTWKIEMWFRGDSKHLDDVGILVDFHVAGLIKEKLDHKNLNQVMDLNPTAENITMWVYDQLKKSIDNKKIGVKVRVFENAVDKMSYCECGDF